MLFSFNEVVLVEPGSPEQLSDHRDFMIMLSWKDQRILEKHGLTSSTDTIAHYSPTGKHHIIAVLLETTQHLSGTEAMLQKHTFLYRPSANISEGDTILVRFRLFSDPFANGWGWVIEDLKIGPLVDALPELTTRPVVVYPNPGKGFIKN